MEDPVKLFSFAAVALALITTSCASEPPSEAPPAPGTTPGDTALRNLDARIDGLEAAYAETGSAAIARSLVDHLLTRTQFAGTFDDFARADEIALELLERGGERAELLVLRAHVAGAQHLFDAAEADLLRAADLGADVAADLSTVRLAVGSGLTEVRAARQERVDRYPSYASYTGAAAAHAALGDFEIADSYFEAARASYRDVSPLPLAWIAFQRGVMWGEKADRADLARGFYEEAVALLPGYVVANVHLAELELAAGETAAAVGRLERIAPTTLDPEPTGFLAEILGDTDPARAAELARAAAATYDELFARYPRAFLDHGAEFFAAATVARDPARAVELALTNLEHRRDARAFIVALESALAADDLSLACELAPAARAAEGTNFNLEALLADLECP
jgi:tetratricopeptide (TPR) repeat protein